MRSGLTSSASSRTSRRPPAAAYDAATAHKAVEYLRVDNTDWTQIRSALASYGYLIIGITAYDSFESEHTAKTGQVTMPKKSEKVVGGHCMRAMGYTSTHLIVANSWSADWGDKGFCYLPKAYCTSAQLSSDWWVLRRACIREPRAGPTASRTVSLSTPGPALAGTASRSRPAAPPANPR